MPLFQNEFLDSICVDPDNALKDLRKTGANKTREELSRLIGISEHSIRRYESGWQNSNPPQWYFMLLRFLSGDLSYFGSAWVDCRIHYHDHKLSSPYFKHTRMTPMDMHLHFNRTFQEMNREKLELQRTLEAKEAHNKALAADNALLMVKIERLENEVERLKHHKDSVRTGKVIPISSHRKA